jgi:NDP-sugar pyrophosphorylase family protein
MEAVILAGGKGTGIQSVVSNVPKPMAPIDGKPFLDYLLKWLECNNISKVILSTGYKSVFSFESDFLHKNELKICAVPFAGYFIDIGVPEGYASAQMLMPQWVTL